VQPPAAGLVAQAAPVLTDEVSPAPVAPVVAPGPVQQAQATEPGTVQSAAEELGAMLVAAAALPATPKTVIIKYRPRTKRTSRPASNPYGRQDSVAEACLQAALTTASRPLISAEELEKVLATPLVPRPAAPMLEPATMQPPALAAAGPVPLQALAVQQPDLKQLPPVPQFEEVASAASSAAAEGADEKKATGKKRGGRAKYMKFWRTLQPESQEGKRIPEELLKTYKNDAGKKGSLTQLFEDWLQAGGEAISFNSKELFLWDISNIKEWKQLFFVQSHNIKPIIDSYQ
jgi:hypothetical protein